MIIFDATYPPSKEAFFGEGFLGLKAKDLGYVSGRKSKRPTTISAVHHQFFRYKSKNSQVSQLNKNILLLLFGLESQSSKVEI